VKIAIIHDWLVTNAGAEKCLEQMLLCYPTAEIFSVVDFLPKDQRAFLDGRTVITTFIQNLPLASRRYRDYLPLMPLAIEQLDLSAYDLILSSSYAVAKGVLTGPDQLHISYVHSPIRYAWDLQHQYLKESGLNTSYKGWLAKWFLHRIRLWDTRTANGVDAWIANSGYIGRRIYKVYGRDSTVIYPPVNVNQFTLSEKKDDFFFTCSRMVPYKKMPMIVEAFSSMPDKQLVVIGDGPEFKKCAAFARSNVTLMGWQPFSVLKEYMQRARAFVFAAEEDFGITPLEAQACGTPVIAFGKGGVLETIRGLDSECPTGVFFDEQSPAAIMAAVKLFEYEAARITPTACRDNALRFSQERFRTEFIGFVEQALERFQVRRCFVPRPASGDH